MARVHADRDRHSSMARLRKWVTKPPSLSMFISIALCQISIPPFHFSAGYNPTQKKKKNLDMSSNPSAPSTASPLASWQNLAKISPETQATYMSPSSTKPAKTSSPVPPKTPTHDTPTSPTSPTWGGTSSPASSPAFTTLCPFSHPQ